MKTGLANVPTFFSPRKESASKPAAAGDSCCLGPVRDSPRISPAAMTVGAFKRTEPAAAPSK